MKYFFFNCNCSTTFCFAVNSPSSVNPVPFVDGSVEISVEMPQPFSGYFDIDIIDNSTGANQIVVCTIIHIGDLELFVTPWLS